MLAVSSADCTCSNITNTEQFSSPSVAQIPYFVWLSDIYAVHLCKRYPYVSFPVHPQGWTPQSSVQASPPPPHISSCLCRIWIVVKRCVGGGMSGNHVALSILSCFIHEIESHSLVTTAATFSHLCIPPRYLGLVCVQRIMMDSSI